MKELSSVLKDIGVGEAAQKVYCSLLTDGEATARAISQRTSITRTSVYDQLKELRKFDMVFERSIDGKTYFTAADVRHVNELVKDRINHIELHQLEFENVMKNLVNTQGGSEPMIRTFDGKDSMKQLMKDILWHDDIELKIMWPHKEMMDVFGDSFLRWFNNRRIKKNISVKTLWPHIEKGNKNHLFQGKDFGVSRKYLDKKQKVSMGYLLYGTKVAFISSTKENFGCIIESKEFADLMEVQFKALWKDANK